MTGNSLVNCSILCWADSIASVGTVLILSFSKNNNDHMCCEIQRKGCHIHTMHMNTHTHTHTVSFTSSECHRSGSPNVYSGLKWREYRTEAVMWKQDHLASHTAVHHFCAAQATFSTIIQHFSTSAPFWPTLNITFVYWRTGWLYCRRTNTCDIYWSLSI